MRLSGTLRSWHDDRGFGFIAPTHGGAELFVHVSALPKDGSRPVVGEKLTYALGSGRDGRPQAIHVQRMALGPHEDPRRLMSRPRKSKPQGAKAIGLLLLLAISTYAFIQYQHRMKEGGEQAVESLASGSQENMPSIVKPPAFKCDGRKYCSQMTSCSEAKLYLKNCPGVEMDGDHDGVPCEQQWCTSPWAK